MSCYSKWSTPVHQLPKSPEVVEERLRDIADNKESLAEKMKECLGKKCMNMMNSTYCVYEVTRALKCVAPYMR